MKTGWQPGWFPTHEDEKRWDLPDSTYCSEGLADLIPIEDSRWCVFPHSKILWTYCLYDKAQQFCHVRSVRVGRNMWKLHIISQYISFESYNMLCQLYFIQFQYIQYYPILYFHIIMGLFLLQFDSFHGGRKPACSSMKACWLWPRAITPMPGAAETPMCGWKVGNQWPFGRFDYHRVWKFLDFSWAHPTYFACHLISQLTYLYHVYTVNTCTYFQYIYIYI